jgi:AcrR family transcriptional regulator
MAQNAFALTPQRRNRKQSPARERLIKAVRTLLLAHEPSEITTTMVLREANVARNTLYLHFEDHANLLETVLLSMFLEGVEQHAALLKSATMESKTKSEFWKRAAEIVRISQAKYRWDFRLARCRLIAHSKESPRFGKLLAADQNKINDKFTELFVELRRKGWMKGNVQPAAAAVLVQALTLGRIVDDVATKKLREEDWNDLYLQIMRKVVFAD